MCKAQLFDPSLYSSDVMLLLSLPCPPHWCLVLVAPGSISASLWHSLSCVSEGISEQIF